LRLASYDRVVQRAEAHHAARQERRGDVERAARRVIIRKGLADTTLRDIAREGGFTTGLLTHHFPDKRAVIFGAFASAWTEWIEKGRQSFALAQTPRELVIALVQYLIPDDRNDQQEWRLWIEMWTYAGVDKEFADEIVPADTVIWQSDLVRIVRRLQRHGMLSRDVDARTEGMILNRLVDGLGVRAWLTGDWDDARRAFVMHLASVGLPTDLVDELLRPLPPTEQRRRRPRPSRPDR
jgi:AcrR family transcriptional regulator